MAALSKSKILAYRQCPRRLWLETHRPALRTPSAATQARLDAGNLVGDIARRLYDPGNTGTFIDVRREGVAGAIERSTGLLQRPSPVFEAGFSAAGALAFADVMLPSVVDGALAWKMVEVKASSSVKDYYLDDAAVQACVARAAGVPLASVSIAHIDSRWTYPGSGDYAGLLVEVDVTGEAFGREADVRDWIAGAAEVVRLSSEPVRRTSSHCTDPHACAFMAHCRSSEPVAQFPVAWLPRIQAKALKHFLQKNDVIEASDVPDSLLTAMQRRVKDHTLSGVPYFDRESAAADLAPQRWPAYFLDFETIAFAVPAWAGTRPFEQIPFQFSVHVLHDDETWSHHGFLELSGVDPCRGFAQALVDHCGQAGPVYVYNAGFEQSRMKELALRFTDLTPALGAINARIVDLLRVARMRYYHPRQEGSWSIKKVLPAIAPDLAYEALEGVQDGGMAMAAFVEAIDAATPPERREQIRRQLFDYCRLDTWAMVRLWAFFRGAAAPVAQQREQSARQADGAVLN